MDIDKILKDKNIVLPEAKAPLANYVPWKIVDNCIYISGQVAMTASGEMITGIVSPQENMDNALAGARACAYNIIAQIKQAVDGDWTKIDSILKLGGFVASSADFTQHPEIINEASNIMTEVFGEKGKHVRYAVGVASLPRNSIVEIEAVIQLKKP